MIQRIIQKWKTGRRQREFESQLVEGIGFVSNALRAGLSLPQAIELTSKDMNGAFAAEMVAICDQMQLGVPLIGALQDSALRFPVTDWRMTVQAAVILLESGGNLIESFQLILETVRDRQRVTEKIRTATTQGKIQAGIISAMPFALAVLLASVSPEYIAPLFTWPTGAGVITMGLLMLAGGVVWMRLILKILIIGVVVMQLSPAIAADYYSVAVDVPTQAVTETAWQETQVPTGWAPQPLEHVVTRGAALILPKEALVPQLAWEMDLGILQPDGNILHLLGTATVLDVTPKTKLATVAAELSGVQANDCHARLSATVDVKSRDIVVEKFAFNCLGHEVLVATAQHPKE